MGSDIEYTRARIALLDGSATQAQIAYIKMRDGAADVGAANKTAAASFDEINRKVAEQQSLLRTVGKVSAGEDIAAVLARAKAAQDALNDAIKAGYKGADLDAYLAKRAQEYDLIQQVTQAQKDFNDAAAIRSASVDGVDKLNEKLADAARFLAQGTISAAEFNGAAANLRSDIQDKYNAAVKDGNTVLAASIQAEYERGRAALQANLDAARGVLAATQAMEAMGPVAANALRSAAGAVEGFGGVFGMLGGFLKQAADGIDQIVGQTSGVKAATEAVKTLEGALADRKPLVFTGKAPGARGAAAAKNLADTYADQIKDARGALDAQLALNAAYAEGPAAIERLKAAQELQSQVSKVNRKYTDEQTAALTDLYKKQAEAKAAGDVLQGTQAIDKNIGLLRKELELVGATAEVREKELALYKARVDLGERANTVEGQRRLEAVASEADLSATLERSRAATQEFTGFFDQAFERIGSTITDAFTQGTAAAIDFGSIAKGMLSEVMQWFLKLGAINPLKNALMGGNLPTIGDVVGGGASAGAGASGASAGGSTAGGAAGGSGPSLSGAASGLASLGMPGGSFMSGASNWLFGQGAVGAAGPQIPTAGVIGSGGQFLGMSGSSLLGGGMSVIGSALPGLASGNYAQAGLGAGGALAGSIVGSIIPGIGTMAGGMVGGMLGNLLGGMFGGAPQKTPFSAGAVKYDDGRFKAGAAYGKGGHGADGVKTLAGTAGQALNDLLKKLDLTVTGALGGLSYEKKLNNRSDKAPGDLTGFTVKGDKVTAAVAGREVYSGQDQQEAAAAFIGGMLKELASGGKLAGDELLTQILKGMKDTSTEGIDKALNLSQAVKAFTTIEDPLSDVQQALKDAKDTAKSLTDQLAEFGINGDKVAEALGKRTAELRKQVNTSLEDGIAAIVDPAKKGLDDLLKAQKQRLDDVKAVGADRVKAERLNALEIQRYWEQLSDAQRRILSILGDAATQTAARMATLLGVVTTGADRMITETTAARDEAIRMGQVWAGIARDLRRSVADLRISDASTLSIAEKMAAQQGQFRETYGRALAGDQNSAQALPQMAQGLLDIAGKMYGSTSDYARIFDDVQGALKQVSAGADTRATGLSSMAATLDAQLDVLNQIKAALADRDQVGQVTDALAEVFKPGVLTEASRTGIVQGLGMLEAQFAGNAAVLARIADLSDAMRDGAINEAEAQRARETLQDLAVNGFEARLDTLSAALKVTGSTVAGLNVFLEDAAGAIPTAIITAFQDGLDEAALAKRMGALMDTTLAATDAAIRGGLTGEDMNRAIMAPLQSLMRGWIKGAEVKLDQTFREARVTIGFDVATGRVVAAYNVAADRLAGNLTKAVATITFDGLARQAIVAEQLVGTRFGKAVGGLTFDGIDGTLLTAAVYGPNGVLTQVAAALTGSVATIRGEMVATVKAADFDLTRAQIRQAVDISARGATQVTIAATDLGGALLRLTAAGQGRIDLIADRIRTASVSLIAVDAGRINASVRDWNSRTVTLAALNTGIVNAAVQAWNGRKVVLRALDAGAVNAAVGAWNTSRVVLTAANAGRINAAVTEWNSRAVTLKAIDSAGINLAVDRWNSRKVALQAIDSAALNLAVGVWNARKVTLTAVNSAAVNLAVDRWNSQKVGITLIDQARINARVGVWNAQAFSLTALNAATFNAAVATWNANRVMLTAADTSRINLAVATWNTQRVALSVLNTAAINARVGAWNGQRFVLTALNTASANAAVAGWNGRPVTLVPINVAAVNRPVAVWNGQKLALESLDARAINAEVKAAQARLRATLGGIAIPAIPANALKVGDKVTAVIKGWMTPANIIGKTAFTTASDLVATDLQARLRDAFGDRLADRLGPVLDPIFSAAGVPSFKSRMDWAWRQIFGETITGGSTFFDRMRNLVGAGSEMVKSLDGLRIELAAQRGQREAATAARRAELQNEINRLQRQIPAAPDYGRINRLNSLANAAGTLGNQGNLSIKKRESDQSMSDKSMVRQFEGQFNAILRTLGVGGSISGEVGVSNRKFTVQGLSNNDSSDLSLPLLKQKLSRGQLGQVDSALADAIRRAGSLADIATPLRQQASDMTGQASQRDAVLKQIADLQAALGALPKYATGGVVGGTFTGIDTQLARLTVGEGVVNLRGMERLGPDGLASLNRGAWPVANDDRIATRAPRPMQMAAFDLRPVVQAVEQLSRDNRADAKETDRRRAAETGQATMAMMQKLDEVSARLERLETAERQGRAEADIKKKAA